MDFESHPEIVGFCHNNPGEKMSTAEKVAFITGANRGIGRETARELGKKKITVILGVRDLEKGKAVAEELRKEGIQAEALQFDITKPSDYQAAYDFFDKRYGKLDILVNNAGIARERQDSGDHRINTASSVSPEILRATFETNFFGTVALTQALLPLIKKSPAGRIVNLSSVLGSLTLHADPTSPIYATKVFAYNSSKTALNAFTIHLAQELSDTKIKVNSAHPGWVKTEMGGPNAPLELGEGVKTSVELATLPENGPTGGYFHLGASLPW
jgi:NAD(P)-dependent dehydrogenase (short-subunit alcohol dehydrogenase family)